MHDVGLLAVLMANVRRRRRVGAFRFGQRARAVETGELLADQLDEALVFDVAGRRDDDRVRRVVRAHVSAQIVAA